MLTCSALSYALFNSFRSLVMPPERSPDWVEVFVAGSHLPYSEPIWMNLIGVSLAVVATIWAALPMNAIEVAGVEPKHLLWLLNWFKKV